MRKLALTCAASLIGLLAFSEAHAAQPTTDSGKPKIEMVFAIDTTGSMGGLIEAAKTKVWSIVNQISTGKPTPDIRVGLVAYRDRGDQYVTSITDLTGDLDAMYSKLMAFDAGGGGDGPESVNQALLEAVNKISWSEQGRVLKLVFLVGDAPPHMDYPNDVKYPEVCKQAVRKNITIHTIRCGSDSQTDEVWKKIAHLSEGQYFSIAQDGGVAEVKTPYDEEIAKIDSNLRSTTVYYGDKRKREEKIAKDRSVDSMLAGAPAEAKAERAIYKERLAKSAPAGMADADLVAAVEAKSIDLNKIPVENLPDDMKKMTPEQRQEFVTKKISERQALGAQLNELHKKRTGYIAEQAKKSNNKDSFDVSVLNAVREKSAKIGVSY